MPTPSCRIHALATARTHLFLNLHAPDYPADALQCCDTNAGLLHCCVLTTCVTLAHNNTHSTFTQALMRMQHLTPYACSSLNWYLWDTAPSHSELRQHHQPNWHAITLADASAYHRCKVLLAVAQRQAGHACPMHAQTSGVSRHSQNHAHTPWLPHSTVTPATA